MTTTEQQTTMTPEQAAWFADTFEKIVSAVGVAVVGKANVIRLVVTTMLSGGHVLLEDVPGTGKTQLARSLAAAVQASSARIQFTPDLLPSDVTGVSILDPKTQEFEFHRGPVFASVVLADVNLAGAQAVAEKINATGNGHRAVAIRCDVADEADCKAMVDLAISTFGGLHGGFNNAGVDTGRIIAQRAVSVQPSDDEATLHERIKVVERELLVQTLTELIGAPA